MKLFKLYIRQHRKVIFFLILFCVIFSISFILYHLPIKAIIYPLLICIFIGCIFIGVDFFHIKYKHRWLFEIKKLTASMISSMPSIESIEDEGYQEIIKMLQNEILNINEFTSIRYQNLTEYYTVWVHQIKTPITSMYLALKNEDTPLSRRLTSYLFQIEQYVEMILVFIRIDSDSRDYVFKEYNIDCIIKQAVTKFASEFIDRKINLEYEPIDKIVITDEKWFSFVIEQILSNALKYTRKGSIKIYMHDSKTLCIEDTGIGIASEDLPRIFEKGYTGYNGRKDKKASGIGLYLCKRICNNLEIGINITSQLDKGTIVHMNLEQYALKKD